MKLNKENLNRSERITIQSMFSYHRKEITNKEIFLKIKCLNTKKYTSKQF